MSRKPAREKRIQFNCRLPSSLVGKIARHSNDVHQSQADTIIQACLYYFANAAIRYKAMVGDKA
jgi:hypothetical protein